MNNQNLAHMFPAHYINKANIVWNLDWLVGFYDKISVIFCKRNFIRTNNPNFFGNKQRRISNNTSIFAAKSRFIKQMPHLCCENFGFIVRHTNYYFNWHFSDSCT